MDLSEANDRKCGLDDFPPGSKVNRFDPIIDMRDGNDRWIHVSEFVHQRTLLKSKPQKCVWKLVPSKKTCWEAL
jgi:hypothetical protein